MPPLPPPPPRSDLVVVRKSKVQGRGVFAQKDIRAGRRVIEYVGERISQAEADARYDDENSTRHHTFLFGVTDDLVIDAKRWGNEAKYINHSCEPNCEPRVVGKRVFIYALRSIRAGEELFYDYWFTTDESYTNADRIRLYPCRCGAAKCRKTLAAPQKKARRKRKL